MDKDFKNDEKLYRAIWPPEMMPIFWKRNGDISTAAFADRNGLSVDRGDYRSDDEVAEDMQKRFYGMIFYLTVKSVRNTGALVNYLPSKTNIYHSEIHGSKESPLLSRQQRMILAQKATRIL